MSWWISYPEDRSARDCVEQFRGQSLRVSFDWTILSQQKQKLLIKMKLVTIISLVAALAGVSLTTSCGSSPEAPVAPAPIEVPHK